MSDLMRPRSPMFRIAIAALALTTGLLAACSSDAPSATSPGEPLAGLTDAQRGRFLLGRALFERLATPEEGLGPLYNAERCSACHDRPATGGAGTSVLVLKATAWIDGRCNILREYGGDNIQQRATAMLLAHGLGPEVVPPEATATKLVTAPPLFGLGLLEAVPEAELLRLEDADDRNNDGISGRVARFADGSVARFGRKGDAATVNEFVDTALRFELGFTTELHPEEESRNGVPVPASSDPVARPEMDSATVAVLTDYVRLLAPIGPDPGVPAATVRRGKAVFREIGCAGCHVARMTTGQAAEMALSGKRIEAYTDLLLHDLGGATADVCTPQAAPGEYRTAPLWGLRYQGRYLHDGTATSIEDAVEAHGGEAAATRSAFRALSATEKDLLLRFLSSL